MLHCTWQVPLYYSLAWPLLAALEVPEQIHMPQFSPSLLVYSVFTTTPAVPRGQFCKICKTLSCLEKSFFQKFTGWIKIVRVSAVFQVWDVVCESKCVRICDISCAVFYNVDVCGYTWCLTLLKSATSFGRPTKCDAHLYIARLPIDAAGRNQLLPPTQSTTRSAFNSIRSFAEPGFRHLLTERYRRSLGVFFL